MRYKAEKRNGDVRIFPYKIKVNLNFYVGQVHLNKTEIYSPVRERKYIYEYVRYRRSVSI